MRGRAFALAGLVLSAACRIPGSPLPQRQADVALSDAAAPDACAPSPLGPPALHVLLADPRFADAATKAAAGDAAGAADALRAAAAPGVDACAVDFLEGRLRARAKDDAAAASAFDRARGTAGHPCRLAPHAALHAAEAYERLGRADDAIARAREALAAHVVYADEAELVLAEALAAKGDRASALASWRRVLSAHPKAARWVDTEVKIANALLDGVDGAPTDHAREALERATRVLVEAPSFGESSGAQAARLRALALVPGAPRDLAPAERLRRAQAWLDGGKPDEAAREATALLPLVKGDATLACRTAFVAAQAAQKLRATPDVAWGKAIDACDGPATKDERLRALYSGGKASVAARKPDEAVARFGRIEKEDPSHRLADDARLQAALVIRDGGDDARAEALLLSLPDDYPAGDMRADALFRVALARMARGDWDGARGPLERARAIDGEERHWSTAGRSAYFLARIALLKGDVDGAKRAFAEIVQRFPLTFYMTQAYARLAELDASAARRAMDDAAARELPGTWPTHEHAVLRSDEMARALALLEVGDVDAARKELAACGATKDDAEPELLWVIADLFDRAGAPDVGSGFSRGRLTDHLPHWPAGRWRFAWEAAFPRAFESVVRREAAAAGIPPSLVWGVMREESAFIVDARSPTGALGLMQLMPATAKEVARGTPYTPDEASLKRADVSVALGAKLLGALRRSFAPNVVLAIPAYNGGPGAVRRWMSTRPQSEFDLFTELVPWEETRGYLKRVLASQATYAYLYEPERLDEVLRLPAKLAP